MTSQVVMEQVGFAYDREEEKRVLDDITIDIQKAEFLAIVGRNGSGKSTLSKLLNALLIPTVGRVLVLGKDTRDQEALYSIRRGVGLVFQNPDDQMVAGIVEEDVAFGLENLGVPPSTIRDRVDEALKTVGLYDERKRPIHELSGGQKQRVAIAGILCMDPEVVVLDECTSMLDPVGRDGILSMIRTLHQEFGKTIVLVTHEMSEVLFAKRVLVMDAGRVVMDGAPREIFIEAEKLKQYGLSLPPFMELLGRVRQLGYPVDTMAFNRIECVKVLLNLLGEPYDSN